MSPDDDNHPLEDVAVLLMPECESERATANAMRVSSADESFVPGPEPAGPSAAGSGDRQCGHAIADASTSASQAGHFRTAAFYSLNRTTWRSGDRVTDIGSAGDLEFDRRLLSADGVSGRQAGPRPPRWPDRQLTRWADRAFAECWIAPSCGCAYTYDCAPDVRCDDRRSPEPIAVQTA